MNNQNIFFKIIRKLLASLKYSYQGFVEAFKIEFSFRIEVVIASIMIPVALFLPVTKIEKLGLIAPIILLMAVELLNSGIEKTIDELGNGEYRERFRFAKDCGSAAVLLVVIIAALSWVVILL